VNKAKEKTMRRTLSQAAIALAALIPTSCSTNVATGQRQLTLISESRELALGRQSDEEIVAAMGAYDDPALSEYVREVGAKLAGVSERSDLAWTFRVMDDPAVNAFALPGGYVYVTRGLLAHLSSEAELATVVGHEVGHVTGRHAVERLSKQQLAAIGLGIGMIASPEVARFGDLAQAGLGVLFLKYSRDDERQADELGLRYLTRAGYDARQSPTVFRTLERVGEAAGGRVPGWLATHPDPGARAETMRTAVAGLATDFTGSRVGSREYLDAVDGIEFGSDPREGYFRGSEFLHPGLAFRLRFPDGWSLRNEKAQVSAASPTKDAAVVLNAVRGSAREAADQLAADTDLEAGRVRSERLDGLVAASFEFEAGADTERYRGRALFVEHGERTFRLLGFSSATKWSEQRAAIEGALESFRPLTDRAALGVRAARLELVEVPRPMSLEEFQRRYPSNTDLTTLAILNHLEEGEGLAGGQLAKRVVGGPPAEP
jgi:predicted Zn-dependent protease